jgi:hypothetical protein
LPVFLNFFFSGPPGAVGADPGACGAVGAWLLICFLFFGCLVLLTDLLILFLPACDYRDSELEPWGLAVPSLVVEFLFHII